MIETYLVCIKWSNLLQQYFSGRLYSRLANGRQGNAGGRSDVFRQFFTKFCSSINTGRWFFLVGLILLGAAGFWPGLT